MLGIELDESPVERVVSPAERSAVWGDERLRKKRDGYAVGTVFVFRWSSDPPESKILDYAQRTIQRTATLIEELSVSSKNRATWIAAKKEPIRPVFKAKSATADPWAWQSGPADVPRIYEGREFIRSVRKGKVQRLVIYGEAGLTTSIGPLTKILEHLDRKTPLVFLVESATLAIETTARHFLHAIRHGGSRTLQELLRGIKDQDAFRQDLKATYKKHRVAVKKNKRAPAKNTTQRIRVTRDYTDDSSPSDSNDSSADEHVQMHALRHASCLKCMTPAQANEYHEYYKNAAKCSQCRVQTPVALSRLCARCADPEVVKQAREHRANVRKCIKCKDKHKAKWLLCRGCMSSSQREQFDKETATTRADRRAAKAAA
ncbi:hypothetical protein JCM11641_003266 [Rhodosporidiobolus odoratus]